MKCWPKRDGIYPDLKFKNRIGKVIHDEEDVDMDVDLLAGVDDNYADPNQDLNQAEDENEDLQFLMTLMTW